jgi:hypothetical protein
MRCRHASETIGRWVKPVRETVTGGGARREQLTVNSFVWYVVQQELKLSQYSD